MLGISEELFVVSDAPNSTVDLIVITNNRTVYFNSLKSNSRVNS